MATGDRLPVESRYQQVINLGIPECYAYIRDAIFAILAEYDIGYIKWDHNRDLIDAGTQPARPPGRARADPGLLPAARRDQGRPPGAGDRVVLLRRRPGRPRRAGAHRPGLGVGLHRPAGAAADAPLDHPADPAGADGLAHRLAAARTPPGAMHDLDFRAATAIFGHLGIEWDLAKAADGRARPSWPPGSRFYKEHRGPPAGRRPGADRLPRRQPDRRTAWWRPTRRAAIYSYASRGPVRRGLARAGADARPRPRPALPGRAGRRSCCPGPGGCRAGGDCGLPPGKRCTPCHRGPDRPCSPMASSESSSAAPRSPVRV